MNRGRRLAVSAGIVAAWYVYYRVMRERYSQPDFKAAPWEGEWARSSASWVPFDDRAATDIDAQIYQARVIDLCDELESELDQLDQVDRFSRGNAIHQKIVGAKHILEDELHIDRDGDDELAVQLRALTDRVLVEVFGFDPDPPSPDVSLVNEILDGIEEALDLRSGPIGPAEPNGVRQEMSRYVTWVHAAKAEIDRLPDTVDQTTVRARSRAVIKRVLLEAFDCDPALVEAFERL